MSWHTSAYFASVAASQTNLDVAAISDGILVIQNGHLIPYKDLMLLYAYSSGLGLVRSRLTSPKLRQITQPQIRPINKALLPAGNPNVAWYLANYLVCRGQEELANQQTTDATAGPNNNYTVVSLSDKLDPIPAGDILTIRATSTSTAVASAWTLVSYTLDDALPTGTYAMISSECISTTSIAHRWTYDGQFLRPGFLGQAADSTRVFDGQYNGRFGSMGRFRNQSLPRLEVLCNAADASFEIFAQVVQVSTTLQPQ